MKGAAAAALALGVVLPMALAGAFPGYGNAAALEHGSAVQPAKREATRVTLIYTAAPVYASLAALRGEERFPRGAQLRALRDGKTEPLTPGFEASADASVSFDGKTVLFAGKKQAGDPWQIWEMPVEGGGARLVIGGRGDAIRPLWMPDGRVVFAERGAEGFGLVTAALDGSARLRLSYLPGNFIPDDVLEDGRVLFESGFPLGAGSTPEIFLVYADGSGVESVRCDHPASSAQGREHGRQLLTGDIVFTHGQRLARFTSALAVEAAVTTAAGGLAGDVAEMPDGRWILAMKKAGTKHYALEAWRPGAPAMTALASDAARDLVEPVVVAPRAIPNRHPSGLHDWKTGNLLALNARLTRSGPLSAAPAAVRMETLGTDGRVVVLGTAPVEADGSFFVQTMGDRPIRFILLDAAGKSIRAEQGWFWVRSGEQRICVGCHTGPERAPDNRVPQVLLRTTTPADMTGAAGSAVGGGH
jgi:hypothetical protein